LRPSRPGAIGHQEKYQSINFRNSEPKRYTQPAMANSATARNAPDELCSFTRVRSETFSGGESIPDLRKKPFRSDFYDANSINW
jgi:hypothetical protein